MKRVVLIAVVSLALFTSFSTAGRAFYVPENNSLDNRHMLSELANKSYPNWSAGENCMDAALRLKEELDYMGVENYIIYGIRDSHHAWNEAHIDQDVYYIDASYPKVLSRSEYIEYYNFVKRMSAEEIEARRPLSLTPEEWERYKEGLA